MGGLNNSLNNKNNSTSGNSKSITQPGVYATFKGYEDDDDYGNVDKEYWGKIVEGNENEEMMEEGDDMEDGQGYKDGVPDFEEQLDMMHQQQLMNQQGHHDLYEKSGVSSIISGMETPEVDLR